MSQSKSLEIRVNSKEDAQAVASQSLKIARMAKESDRSIELLIDETVQKEAAPYLAGLFGPVKVYQSFVRAREGNVLYLLGHLKVAPVATPVPNAKPKKGKPGRPVKKV